MKMVKSGKVKSIVEEVENRDVTYIVLDNETEEKVRKGIIPLSREKELSIEETLKSLSEEVKLLREELDSIKKRL
jgi:hypothetical protein